jgi:predicted DNA-binding transcriptional regulator YafY
VRFTPRKPFDLEKRLKNSIGAHTGGTQQKIRLRFSRNVRTFVLERHWHRTEKLIPNADGTVDLTFTAPVNEELQRFVFRWGADVRVVASEELRKAVAAEGRRLVAQYECA